MNNNIRKIGGSKRTYLTKNLFIDFNKKKDNIIINKRAYSITMFFLKPSKVTVSYKNKMEHVSAVTKDPSADTLQRFNEKSMEKHVVIGTELNENYVLVQTLTRSLKNTVLRYKEGDLIISTDEDTINIEVQPGQNISVGVLMPKQEFILLQEKGLPINTNF